MRIVNIDLDGREYPAAFTVHVLAELEDRYNLPASRALREVLDSGKVRDAVWLLWELLKAGARLVDGCPEPPDMEELLDMIPGDDAFTLCASALAQARGYEARVQLKESDAKNGEATP